MHKDGRIKIMLRNKPKTILVPAVGDVITESHKYETGTTIIPPPVLDLSEADQGKVRVSWRCVAQTVIMDPTAASDTYRWTLVVTWQCEAVEWVEA